MATDPEHEAEAEQRLAAFLREARQRSGHTLREVARQAGGISDPAYLSRAFRGRQTLSPTALDAVASVFGTNANALLAEAGIDPAGYRSRHRKRPMTGMVAAHSGSSTQGLAWALAGEVAAVRTLKRSGQAAAARSAIDAVERVVRLEHGRFPADRAVLVGWAGLLAHRVGITQDTTLPRAVVRSARPDLDSLRRIADTLGSSHIRATAAFMRGDVYNKAGSLNQAITSFEHSAELAPGVRLRLRSRAGLAIALAKRRAPGDASRALRLCNELIEQSSVEAVADGVADEPAVPDLWTADLIGRDLWITEISARTLLMLEEHQRAAHALETALADYLAVQAQGVDDLCFGASLARSHLRAACAGALDVDQAQLHELAGRAWSLANRGPYLSIRKDVASLVRQALGRSARPLP